MTTLDTTVTFNPSCNLDTKTSLNIAIEPQLQLESHRFSHRIERQPKRPSAEPPSQTSLSHAPWAGEAVRRRKERRSLGSKRRNKGCFWGRRH
ncbi:hypothetical protein G7K_0508-t1 [Saitoella complicata NRRL Y-17804]|uniref:Uncharacterized protein n=1 Tax=Saitoella complicata (strain BCRC 22490 / CBS 7301 / JCM 7358 / NBRC 10748 / NRRL Y-17804) TaxID=698492 RepID=A0A0E9NA42_SAICN|nr:hypothetical protein G7K_0508-t1 [Saitoella complicata NRRL Y-17804]